MLATIDSPEQFIQLFNSSIAKARSGDLTLLQLFASAESLTSANQPRLAAQLYTNWIAFNDAHELAYMAYFNLAVVLRALDDHAGAINALTACARRKSDFHQARINLGRVFEDCGHIGQAVEQWRLALGGLSGVSAESQKLKLLALQQLGRVLEEAENLDAAENILKEAMELRPDRTEAAQHWISLRQRQCKWPIVQASEHVSTRQILEGMSPISLALHADDPMFQLARAYRYNKSFVGRPEACRPAPRKDAAHARLRIGYASSDLREHAVGFALVEIFELHDKSRFEIFAYYFGEPRTADATHSRFKASVDHWRDIADLDDEQAAMEIARDEIDILVDLNGYTKHARTGIFARRPAPIIVNWCGYPGTMGTPCHQYLIADAQIVPPWHERFYSEKILRLPCNQPLDRKREIAKRAVTRSEEGLPEDGFVYCCLNGMQKITQDVFDRWMTILRSVPDSVLWLLAGAPEAEARLRARAGESGVAPSRILFAQKRPNAQHLSRIALADLFLDTFPYGAHSTAADALTAGVPVLTRPGRSFAARFCASVVHAAGLPDLACATFDDYVAKAIALGQDRRLARNYRTALRQGRKTSVLRDIPATARRLEELYFEMRDARDAKALPIPDLTNLDVYYEIGAELDFERVNQFDDAEYLELYRRKLAEWHERSPLPKDRRLWRGGSAAEMESRDVD
jgi:predicted O-linked N-acetylglucosamine transferase (SPINDLY family)